MTNKMLDEKCFIPSDSWVAYLSMYGIKKCWDSTSTYCKILAGLGISVSKYQVSALGHGSKIAQDIENYFVVNHHVILRLSWIIITVNNAAN